MRFKMKSHQVRFCGVFVRSFLEAFFSSLISCTFYRHFINIICRSATWTNNTRKRPTPVASARRCSRGKLTSFSTKTSSTGSNGRWRKISRARNLCWKIVMMILCKYFHFNLRVQKYFFVSDEIFF